ncbi:hypothetical protein WJX84_010072 [Apatococcus fuscideae]|uniref:Uncharacterized protein n=1 Tax=Apatococcus fuscideae TaxID=2026836 RepID=A0AAW1T452_9CHLO
MLWPFLLVLTTPVLTTGVAAPSPEAQQNELQLALFDTINNLIGAQFTILNLTEAAHGRRHLLQAAEALQVTVQMDTHSTSHVNDISQQLSNTVNNGQLQAAARKRGLNLSNLSLQSVRIAAPAAANCPGATAQGLCLGKASVWR